MSSTPKAISISLRSHAPPYTPPIRYAAVGLGLLLFGAASSALLSDTERTAARSVGGRLAQADRGAMTAQLDLAKSWIGTGDAKRQQGDFSAAVEAYRQALSIYDRLAEQDPGSAAHHRGLAEALRAYGDVLLDQADFASALDTFRRALAEDERALQLDPNFGDARHNLIADLGRIGIASFLLGDRAGAEAALTRAKTLADQAVAAHPDDKPAQADKAWIDGLIVKLKNP